MATWVVFVHEPLYPWRARQALSSLLSLLLALSLHLVYVLPTTLITLFRALFIYPKFHFVTSRLDTTRSTCRAHAFWLCQVVDTLVSTRSTRRTYCVATWRAKWNLGLCLFRLRVLLSRRSPGGANHWVTMTTKWNARIPLGRLCHVTDVMITRSWPKYKWVRWNIFDRI